MPAEIKIICPQCGKRTIYLDHTPGAKGRDINATCHACSYTAKPDKEPYGVR